MTELSVLAPGSKVKIADGSIPAMISAVTLYAHGGVLYEAVWWIEGSRNSAWLYESEMIAEGPKVTVGFKVN